MNIVVQYYTLRIVKSCHRSACSPAVRCAPTQKRILPVDAFVELAVHRFVTDSSAQTRSNVLQGAVHVVVPCVETVQLTRLLVHLQTLAIAALIQPDAMHAPGDAARNAIVQHLIVSAKLDRSGYGRTQQCSLHVVALTHVRWLQTAKCVVQQWQACRLPHYPCRRVRAANDTSIAVR